MAITLIGALSVAILAACVAFILYRLTGVFPKWIIPVAAGTGMLGFTIWNDYTWFGRTVAALPDTVQVTDSFGQTHFLQPWSLVVAPTARFRAVDLRTVERHPESPSIRRAAVFIAARFSPTFVTPQIFDCERNMRADADPASLGGDGLPRPEAWVAIDPANPLLRAVCDARVG
jgi:hypothetical protein